MAIRNIVREGDDVLSKVCKPVEVFDEKLWQLLDDMRQTLKKADGVGLAAPQVGVLRRIFIMDVGQGVVECINPKILSASGSQHEVEGCLSCPGEYGITERPAVVKLQAQDRHGKFFIITTKDLLTARCICHENDHLDGILFKKHVIQMLDNDDVQ